MIEYSSPGCCSSFSGFPFLSFPACLESRTRDPERARNIRVGTGISVKLAAAWSNGNVSKTTISHEIHFLPQKFSLQWWPKSSYLSCSVIPFHHYFYSPQNWTPNQINEGFEAALLLIDQQLVIAAVGMSSGQHLPLKTKAGLAAPSWLIIFITSGSWSSQNNLLLCGLYVLELI